MTANLFMQSIQHLLSSDVKKSEVSVTQVKPIHVKIYVDKGVVCHSIEEACRVVIESEKELLPEGFRNFVTGNLLRGTIDKQIDSIFKDFKKYGKQVAPKVQSFFSHMLENKDAYYKFLDKLSKDLSPTDDSKNGKIDGTYFKIWFLFNYLKENNLLTNINSEVSL